MRVARTQAKGAIRGGPGGSSLSNTAPGPSPFQIGQGGGVKAQGSVVRKCRVSGKGDCANAHLRRCPDQQRVLHPNYEVISNGHSLCPGWVWGSCGSSTAPPTSDPARAPAGSLTALCQVHVFAQPH